MPASAHQKSHTETVALVVAMVEFKKKVHSNRGMALRRSARAGGWPERGAPARDEVHGADRPLAPAEFPAAPRRGAARAAPCRASAPSRSATAPVAAPSSKAGWAAVGAGRAGLEPPSSRSEAALRSCTTPKPEPEPSGGATAL